MSGYGKVFLHSSPRPCNLQHSTQITALAEVGFVADETDWSLERPESMYMPLNRPGSRFGLVGAANQAFWAQISAAALRIFQVTVFFQTCLRRSRQAHLPQTLPLSP